MSNKLLKSKKINSIGDLLVERKTELDDLFIELNVLNNISSFTGAFSSDLSSFWGFEIPISENANGVDFLFCIHQPEIFQTWIQEIGAALFGSNRFSEGICHFSNQWSGKLKPFISNIWFEYDFEAIQARKFSPNFFIGPRKGLNALHLISIIQPIFNSIGGNGTSANYKLLLQVILKSPPGSWVSQIGQMLAREDRNLRVFIQDLPLGTIPHFLTELNYSGNIHNDLLDLLRSADSLCKKVELDLDIGVNLGKNIGIELYFDHIKNALSFLKLLQENGLCTMEKYESLNSHLLKLRVDKFDSMNRFFSHFKIGFDGNSSLKAKAYIGFITTDQMPNAFGSKPINLN